MVNILYNSLLEWNLGLAYDILMVLAHIICHLTLVMFLNCLTLHK